METVKTLSNSIVKDGVQAIVLVKDNYNIFSQKYLLVQDHDDRKRGDGIRKIGLTGGGIERDETPEEAIIREIKEEISLEIKRSSLWRFGCYTKLRPNGFINNNNLFILKLKKIPKLKTNDPNEVSKVIILSLREIISLSAKGFVHEGSIRLIIHYLNGEKSGSLNEPAILNGLIKF